MSYRKEDDKLIIEGKTGYGPKVGGESGNYKARVIVTYYRVFIIAQNGIGEPTSRKVTLSKSFALKEHRIADNDRTVGQDTVDSLFITMNNNFVSEQLYKKTESYDVCLSTANNPGFDILRNDNNLRWKIDTKGNEVMLKSFNGSSTLDSNGNIGDKKPYMNVKPDDKSPFHLWTKQSVKKREVVHIQREWKAFGY
jgi:hypothetical protein